MEQRLLGLIAWLTEAVLVTDVCTAQGIQSVAPSLSSTARISIVSYEDMQKPNAKESYDASCGSEDLHTSEAHVPQQLVFPANSSRYPNNIVCFWSISTLPLLNYVVHVTFTFFDIEASPECSSACVVIADSSTDSPGKLCGQLTQHDFYSISHIMVILFNSNSTNTGEGFRLNYEAVRQSEVPSDVGGVCFRKVRTLVVLYDPEDLKYPSNSSHYANNTNCEWLLQVSDWSYAVAVNFTFVDIEARNCCLDYVELFDGQSANASSLGRICGAAVRDFRSSGPSMYIKFHSDNSTTGRGFQLTYKAVPRSTAYQPSSSALHPAAVFGIVMAGAMILFFVFKLGLFLARRLLRAREQQRSTQENLNTN